MLERNYSEGFKRQAVQKLYTKGSQPTAELARELGCSLPSLYRWSKNMKPTSVEKSTSEHSAKERFDFVLEHLSLPAEEQGLWLRRNGLTTELLAQWQESMMEALSPRKTELGLGRLKKQVRSLEHDLRRRDRKLKQKELIIDVQKKVLEMFKEDPEELPQ